MKGLGRMKWLAALFLIVSLFLPTSTVLAQDDLTLTVADWSFEVVGAVKGPTISDVVHLGALEDGRHWLVVTLVATNTSSDTHEIHSDKVQLRVDGETVKQTGSESEGAASELEYMSIGGSTPHDVDAGEVLQVVQVYKVAPDASEFTLIFRDFTGNWEIPISTLVAASAGNSRALLGEAVASTDGATPVAENAWSISTADFELFLIGAAVASTYSGAFHLGILDDGRSWLVVTYRLQNNTDNEVEIKSEAITVLSNGQDVAQAGDETHSVADELDVATLTTKLGANEDVVVVQVFKVAPEALDNALQVSWRGAWFLNLRPVIDATNGDANAIAPDTALDLASINVAPEVAQAIPTQVPTATPAPTSPPTPAPTAPTVAPTATPKPESAVASLPTIAPTPEPASTSELTEQELDYLSELDQDAAEFGAALGETGQLFEDAGVDPTLIFDQDWIVDVAEQFVIMRDIGEQVQSMNPSPRQAHIHALWLEINRLTGLALDEYTLFIDNLDFDAASRGTAYIIEATGLVNELSEARVAFEQNPNVQSAPVEIVGPVANCEAFADFAEAQDYYAVHPEEQPTIDPDFDGLACEVYFGQ